MIGDYLSAGYPALCVLTHEPSRAEINLSQTNGWSYVAWDCSRGLRKAGTQEVLDETQDPREAIEFLSGKRDVVLFLHNLQFFLDNPEIIQGIANGVETWKSHGCCLVVLTPEIRLPSELEKCFAVLDYPLPDEEELFGLQSEIAQSLEIPTNETAAFAARGLTCMEAESSFALSLVRKNEFSVDVISEVKSQMLRKSGLLEFWEPADIEEVGGLQQLKSYIYQRSNALLSPTTDLPKPKGILLCGIPGTGKSLSCKATANMLGWPLIRLDIGALKGSLVGESEQKMRQATKIIDAFGQCVVWLDEVEKAFAGSTVRQSNDSGTSAGMFSHWLTWLQETASPILVMATANDVQALPPEFLRTGRFDATFFVDLPVQSEREEIINIMNGKYGSEIPENYAKSGLEGYTGAEIEQLAKDSLFDRLDNALQNLVPISKVMKEEIEGLRKWARSRARLANSLDDTSSVRQVKEVRK